MRLNGTLWRGVRLVLAAGLAAVVYVVLVPQKQVDHRQVGSLVVSRTAVPGLPSKARLAQWVDPSTSTFAVVRRAARRDPDHAGIFVREWYVAPDAPPEVGIVLELLPDSGTARQASVEGLKQLLTVPRLSGEKAGAGTAFSLPGVPGGRGASFPLADTSVGANGIVDYAYKTVFRFDRTVVSELVVATGSTRSTSGVSADATAAYRLLQQREPTFSLVHTRLPPTASIVFAVIGVVVVAGAVVVPEWVLALVQRRRARRLARAEVRARQQYLARGRRTVRGHGAPPWAKTKRR